MGASRTGLVRRVAVMAAATGLWLACTTAFAAAGASAETLTASCANLQAQIDTAATSKGTDTVVLDGLCKPGTTLPANASFTLEGAPGTTSGFDGEGVSTTTKLLTNASEATGAMSLRNLTFENADTESFTGGALYLAATSVTLTNDHFLNDTAHDSYTAGGGAYLFIVPSNEDKCEASEAPALTVTESSFEGDRALGTGGPSMRGGGLEAVLVCPDRASSMVRDSFTADTVETTGSGEAAGGGVALLSPSSEGPALIYQQGNVFDSDAVVGPAEGNRGGGGEWLEGINLTSLADRFSRNSIAGTSGAKWSWGAGLGILNTNCNTATATESTLEDAVVAGNSIGAGTAADLGGAGIYVGIACGPDPENHSHLRLLDSTVTENTVPTGGTAGIDGHPADQLALVNSIVAANPGGVQIRGFTGTGGSLTSAFSDVCDEAATAPLSGEGNICAAPLLADEGNVASFDVHETQASPTIDAGSNALVPSGLGKDFYGDQRIAASVKHLGCGDEPGVGPATVDMGADEYAGAVVRGPAPPCLPPHPRGSSFNFPKITQLPRGAIKLSFTKLGTGKLTIAAKFTLTRLVTVKVHGRKLHRHRTETITLGHSALTISKTGTETLTLTPSKRVRAILATHRHELLKLTITYTATGDLATTKTKTFTDTYKLPPRKKHHG